MSVLKKPEELTKYRENVVIFNVNDSNKNI